MDSKLNCILLVDDSEADNYLHRMVIEEADCTNHIVVVLNGKEALNYLRENLDGPRYPELILLDINMPIMGGWEFIDAYIKAGYNEKTVQIITMLTTSDNPGDLAKAGRNKVVTGFVTKPLDVEKLTEIIEG